MRTTRTIGTLTVTIALGALSTLVAAETLVIQTWSGVWETGARAVGDSFAKKYNVDVKYEQQQNTRLGIAKLRAQVANPTIDIAFSTNDALEQAASENLLVPIDLKAAPGLSVLPPKFVHKNYLEVMNILFGLIYRKDMAPFELTKWDDLADPRLKGKLGVPTAQFAGGRWLIMAALASGGSENNLEPGMAYLRKIKPNVLSFYSTDGESVKVIQSGEVAVAGFGILSDFAKLLGPSSPYRFVIPDGSPVLTSVVSVGMANPKNTALSLKFLEHIAQPEAQAAYCAVINCTPVNPKASPPEAIKDFRPAPERIYAADFSIINKKLPEWDEWYKKEIQAR
jgi:putative spermidine/putrescine transport system substrate-binding protein